MSTATLVKDFALGIVAAGIVLTANNAVLAQEIPAECAELAKSPSIGPPPAEVVKRCNAAVAAGVQPVASPSVVFDNTVYGVEAVSAYSLVKFSLTDPASLLPLHPFTAGSFVSGCDFDNSGFYERLYCIDTVSPSDFYTLNTTDGSKTLIGQASTVGGETFTSLAMDPTSGVMYATSTNCGAASFLHTINLKTGQANFVGTISTGSCLVSSGVDNQGRIFAIDILSDSLIRIDKATGAGTVVGPIGFNANFGQGMDCDERTGACFLFAFNLDTFQPELRLCDTDTGATTFLGRIGGPSLQQITSAAITRFTWPKFRPATSGAGVRH